LTDTLGVSENTFRVTNNSLGVIENAFGVTWKKHARHKEKPRVISQQPWAINKLRLLKKKTNVFI
jgi:hypothetical protein